MKVKRVFRGRPKGEIYPVTYRPGDDVPPELVAAAKAVAADQEPKVPPSKIKPQSVSQRGPDGKTGTSVKSRGKAKSGPAKEDAAETETDDETGTETDEAAETETPAEQSDADDAADDKAAGSGDPKLGGLG